MILDIRGVSDAGNLSKERVVLFSLAEVEIGRFLLTRNGFISEGSIDDVIKGALWLPDQVAGSGSHIVVYTKKGTNSTRLNKDESTSYFIYWGLEEPVWRPGDAAVLIEIGGWEMKKV